MSEESVFLTNPNKQYIDVRDALKDMGYVQ